MGSSHLDSIRQKVGAFVIGFGLILSAVGVGALVSILLPATTAYATPVQCTPNDAQTIVSDTNTYDTTDNHAAVAVSNINSAWTASSPPAIWIWGEDPVAEPVSGATEVFSKDFTISGLPKDSTLKIAGDNSFSVSVNGNDVAACDDITGGTFANPITCTIPASDLATGSNTITFTVNNFADPNGTPDSNPAGLLYNLSVNSQTCTPPQLIEVVATKVMCQNESDLPAWGGGGFGPITSTTAQDWVNTHPSCSLEPGWTFEYGDSTAGDGGDATIGHVDGYTPFGPTDGSGSVTTTIPLSALDGGTEFHLREQLQDGFIPFTYDAASTTPNGNPVSAQFYCANDALNYDNWDFIRNPVAGTTYYCVAFNAPTPSPAPQNTCVDPNATGAPESPVTFGSSDEPTLQSILTDNGYSLDTTNDQKNYQSWDGTGNTVDFTAKFLAKYAGYTHVFGYYTGGNLATFTPLFADGSAPAPYDSVPVKSVGDSVSFSVPNVGVPGVGFAIAAYNGSTLVGTWATQESLNTDNTVHAVVYNPSSDQYVMSFEDLMNGGDNDFNDIVVALDVTGCQNAPTCDPDQQLIQNGSFETPVVSTPQKWDIFPSGTSGLVWGVDWYGGSTTFTDGNGTHDRPEVANIELQQNGIISGWNAADGNQWTELDSDWDGPNGSINGEPASVSISQDVTTIPGTQYTFSFDFSPRPDQTNAAENEAEALENGILIGTAGPTAGNGSTTDWTPYGFTFTATSGQTTTNVALRDAGPSDSVGTFVDDVGLMCVPPETGPTTGSLTVIKIVDGSDVPPADFDISVQNDATNVDGSPQAGSDTGTTYSNLNPGTYNVSEDSNNEGVNLGDYSTNFSGDCYEDGNVDLASGEDATCTITNTYAPQTPPSCTIVSDTNTFDATDSHQAVDVVTPYNSAWTATSNPITLDPSAVWIWGEDQDADTTVDSTKVFTRTFDIVGAPAGGSIDIGADNGFVLKVNGHTVVDDSAVENNYSASQYFDISSDLVSGTNVVEFDVTNFGLADSDWTTNPAGLVYELNLPDNECSTPSEGETGTLEVDKVIVNNQDEATPDQFSFQVTGSNDGTGSPIPFDPSGTTDLTVGTDQTYSVAEVSNSDYVTTYSNNENADANCDDLTVPATCTVTNTFVGGNDGGENTSDLSMTKTVDNGWPTIGDDVTYTLKVANNGPDIDTGVVVDDMLPAGVTWVSDTGAGAYDHSSGVWTIGSLPDGSTATLQITVNVDSEDTPGEIDNTATAYGDNADTNPSDNTDTASIDTVAGEGPATLTIVKNAIGGDGTFNFEVASTTVDGGSEGTTTVTSSGTATSYPFLLNPGSYDVTEFGTSGWNFDSVDCEYGGGSTGEPIAGGDEITVDSGDTVTCTFTNTKQGTEGNQSDIGVTKTVDNDSPDTGETVTYTITASDTGADATGVVINDVLPSDLTFVSTSSEDTVGLYNPVSGNWTIDNLSSTTPATLHILATVNDSVENGTKITNTATVTGGDTSDDPDNNSASADVTVTIPQTPGPVTPTFVLGNGPIVGGGGGGGGGFTPEVLGASTSTIGSCTQYLTAFVKFGNQNDSAQVTRLQEFLNQFEGDNLTVNGIYDAATLAALEAFQAKYAADILTPWGETSPTGYVYLTTRREVNIIYCNYTLQFPLTPEQIAEITAYKAEFGGGNGGGSGGGTHTRNVGTSTPATNNDENTGTENNTSSTTPGLGEVGGAGAAGGGFWSFITHLFHF